MFGSEVDTTSMTDLIGQIEENAGMVFDEDMNQMVVPKVKMLPLLYGQSEGQEGEAQEKNTQDFFQM